MESYVSSFNQFVHLLETPLPLTLLITFLLLLFSAFLKFSIVFGFLRVGLGMENFGGMFLSTGISLALAYFVMYPTFEKSFQNIPVNCKEQKDVCLKHVSERWKQYITKETPDEQKNKFKELARKVNSHERTNSVRDSLRNSQTEQETNNQGSPDASNNSTSGDSPVFPSNTIDTSDTWQVLAPAYIVSEIKKAFSIGIKILLPFLVIDLVIAYLFTALQVTTISAITLSFPLKIIAFTALDGWSLVVENLIKSTAGI